MAAGGAPTVEVRAVGPRCIELELLVSAPPSAATAHAFGQALATVHDSGVSGEFGCPPEDFTGRCYIGNRPMSSVQHARWGEFYVTERVLPFVRTAVDLGHVDPDSLVDIERACAVIAEGTFDDREPPSRIHGDLWNGNVMWVAERGAVLIDPAAHGGHRETDLAMLALFGCPQLDEIIAGYRETHPLRPGWQDRVPVHQLHPLAVHAAGHGPGYGRALHAAALATLRLA